MKQVSNATLIALEEVLLFTTTPREPKAGSMVEFPPSNPLPVLGFHLNSIPILS